MSRARSLILTLLVLLVAAATTTTALADRRTGLGGNRLFEDRDDIFAYPQRILDYRNLIMFDYGATQGSGNGVMLLGSEAMAFGVAVHRGDILTPDVIGLDSNLAWLTNPAHPLLGTQAIPADATDSGAPGVTMVGGAGAGPLTLFDILFGMKAGPGAFGVRLGLGTDGNSAKPPGAGENAVGNFFLMGNLGYSIKGNFRLDTSLNFLYDTSSAVVAGDTTETSDIIRIGLSARGFAALDPKIDLGFLGDITFQNQGHEQNLNVPDGEVTNSGMGFGLLVGVGPAYKVNENTTIAGYAVLGIGYRSGDTVEQVDQQGQYSGTSFVFPGFRMAFETALTSWLYVRSGLQYTYNFLSNTEEQATGDQENASRAANFGWNAGLGIKIADFFFDGAFQHSFLTNGPDFIGGAGGGMFTMVSAGIKF